MIRNFHDRDTENLYNRKFVKRFEPIERVALRNLVILNNARSLLDLQGPQFSLEVLKDDRRGQHSIRISETWRVCFVWKDRDAYRVEIADYRLAKNSPQSANSRR